MAVKTKEEAGWALAQVNDERRFFCDDGSICGSLTELAGCLNKMTPDTFQHHVTADKNDFSNWVRMVFGDDKLADELLEAGDAEHARKMIIERIIWLQKKVGHAGK
jgi:hypothetical protein